MTTPAIHPLEQVFDASWEPSTWLPHPVVVAVSGGADSVALLRLLVAAAARRKVPSRLIVAHFNHQWRGAASLEDEQFVRGLAATFGLAIEVERGQPRPPSPEGSQGGRGPEAQARAQRYGFLRQVAARHGARYIATGHTRDDQVETILHRILRGTGLKGLAGIPRLRRVARDTALIRPLLAAPRSLVEDYLAALGQRFCRDASNDERHYTRNRLRHELLPLLRRDYHAAVDASLLRLAELAGEASGVLEGLVAALRQEAEVTVTGAAVQLLRGPLAAAPEYVVSELLAAIWRTQQWSERGLSRAALRSLTQPLRDLALTTHRHHAPGGIELTLAGPRAQLAPVRREV